MELKSKSKQSLVIGRGNHRRKASIIYLERQVLGIYAVLCSIIPVNGDIFVTIKLLAAEFQGVGFESHL